MSVAKFKKYNNQKYEQVKSVFHGLASDNTLRSVFFLLMVLILFVFSLSFYSYVAFADSTGCCLNPIVSSGGGIASPDLCQGNVPQAQCCPSDFSYVKNNPFAPTNQTNCAINFFKQGSTCDLTSGSCRQVCCCNSTGALFVSPVYNITCGYWGGTWVNLTIPDNGNCSLACHSQNPNPPQPHPSPVSDCYKTKPKVLSFDVSPKKGSNELNVDFSLNCTSSLQNYNLYICNCSSDLCNNCDYRKINNPNLWMNITLNENHFQMPGLNMSVSFHPVKYAFVIGAIYSHNGNKFSYLFNDSSDVRYASPGDAVCYGVKNNDKFCIDDNSYFKRADRVAFIANFYSLDDSDLDNLFSDYYNTGGFCNPSNEYIKSKSCSQSEVCYVGRNGALMCGGNDCNKYDGKGGLSVDESGCVSDYCFLDIAPSTYNYCYSCAPGMNCYDYKSESSCETDNCNLKANGMNCKWLSNGVTGICYDSNHLKFDFCGKLGSGVKTNDPIFTNDSVSTFIYENYDLVSNLLKSHGIECGDSGLKDCYKVFDCYDYGSNKTQCLGGSSSNPSFLMNFDNSITGQHKDSCNTGDYCNFNNGKCIRYIHESGKSSTFYSGLSDECKRDFFPPKTFIHISDPNEPVSLTNPLIFYFHDKRKKGEGYKPLSNLARYTLYMCNENSGSHYKCKNGIPLRLNLSALSISFDSSTTAPYKFDLGKYPDFFVNGNNTFEFFTADPCGNLEIVQRDSVNVDTRLCSDSDGNSTNVKGTLNFTSNGVSHIFNDSCDGKYKVKEFYCEPNPKLGSSYTSEDEFCDYDKICNDGACVLKIAKCENDSDGNGITITFFNGSSRHFGNYCNSSKNIVNYVCTSDAAYTIHKTSCGSGKLCDNGKCQYPADSCFDTDFGKNYDVFGEVSGFLSGGLYNEKDQCKIGSKSTLIERYCGGNNNNEPKEETHDCGTGKYCAGGMCKYNTTSCKELSSGKGINIILTNGSSKIIKNKCKSGFTNKCGDEIFLTKSTCDGNGISYSTQNVNCTNNAQICSNDACLTPSDSCTSTVSKGNYYVKGYVYGYKNGRCYHVVDSCFDNDTLSKVFCDGNSHKRNLVSCGSDMECYDGACVEILLSCSKDGATVTVTHNSTNGLVTNFYTDYCNGSILYTYNCGSDSNGNPILNVTTEDCANSQEVCRNDLNPPQCGKNPDYNKPCVYSRDCSGDSKIALIYKGAIDAFDQCESNGVVEEINCSKNGQVCNHGSCVDHTPYCIDSDGGIVFNISGNVSGYNSSNDFFNKGDFCNGYWSLNEFFCNKNKVGSHNSKTYNCSTDHRICSGGACVIPSSSCYDNNGIVNGTYGNGSIYSGKDYSFTDVCLTGNLLRDYSCNGNQYNVHNVNCSVENKVCLNSSEANEDGIPWAHCGCSANKGNSCSVTKCNGSEVVKYDGSINCAGKCILNYSSSSVVDDCANNYNPSKVCYNAKCVIGSDNCKDSDNGKNYKVFGNISGIYDGSYYLFNDSCQSSSVLTEYFCDGKENASVDFSCDKLNNKYNSFSCSNGRCLFSHCLNNYIDGGETDVDCGDGCPGCGFSQACIHTNDCLQPGLECLNGFCVPPPPTCDDKRKDGNETGVDCGGNCPGCGLGQHCNHLSDCKKGLICLKTLKGGFCSEPPAYCSNGNFNPEKGETDVDCGGANCLPCGVGKNCTVNSDCKANYLCDGSTHKCAIPPDHCHNKKLDPGLESDKDCGIKCPPCQDDMSCKDDSDCQSGVCKNSTCIAKGKKENGINGSCDYSVDCNDSLVCLNGLCKEPPAHCFNNKIDVNDGETGKDCGGSCRPCGLNVSCKSNSDCLYGLFCNNVTHTCLKTNTTNHCKDGIQDYDETGKDCGGSCPACGYAGKCKTTSDCSQGLKCYKGICINSSSFCNNQKWDATYGETDVDCGGPCSQKCLVGQKCKLNSDCFNSSCVDGKCTATGVNETPTPVPTNTTTNSTTTQYPATAEGGNGWLIFLIVMVILASLGGLWYYDYAYNNQKWFGKINKKILEWYAIVYEKITGKKLVFNEEEIKPVQPHGSYLFTSGSVVEDHALKNKEHENYKKKALLGSLIAKSKSLFDEFEESNEKKSKNNLGKSGKGMNNTKGTKKGSGFEYGSDEANNKKETYETLDELSHVLKSKDKKSSKNNTRNVGNDSGMNLMSGEDDNVIAQLNNFASKHNIDEDKIKKFLNKSENLNENDLGKLRKIVSADDYDSTVKFINDVINKKHVKTFRPVSKVEHPLHKRTETSDLKDEENELKKITGKVKSDVSGGNLNIKNNATPKDSVKKITVNQNSEYNGKGSKNVNKQKSEKHKDINAVDKLSEIEKLDEIVKTGKKIDVNKHESAKEKDVENKNKKVSSDKKNS